METRSHRKKPLDMFDLNLVWPQTEYQTKPVLANLWTEIRKLHFRDPVLVFFKFIIKYMYYEK